VPDHPPDPPDTGAAWERTRLAWRRTVLSAAGVALLAARLGIALMPGETAGVVLGAAALVGWTVFAALSARRMRTLAAHHAGRATTEAGPIMVTAAGAVGYAVLGVGIVLIALA
jgi:uncharacterized membrane protein YidH (DUF202 family)